MQSQTGSRRPRSLVLASASPRRRHLIGAFGLPFEVDAADLDETPLPNEAADALALRLARAKALAVARRAPGRAVLAADSVVALGDRLLGKPVDADEAREMLRALRGGQHRVVTGLALATGPGGIGEGVGGEGLIGEGLSGQRLRPDNAPGAADVPDGGIRLAWHGAVETRVEMRAYSDPEIERYVATGRPLDKAGAYAIQDPEFAPVARIVGCYPNVVGLPLCDARRALAAGGLLAELTPEEVSGLGPECPACRLCTVARELEPPA